MDVSYGLLFSDISIALWMYGFHTANTGTYIYNDF